MSASEHNEILFCFTVDTDSDVFWGNGFPKRNSGDKTILGWKGLEKGKNVLCEMADRQTDSYGNTLAITWFVRSDYQIKSQYGEYGYLLSRYRHWWKDRIDIGDEIQWHAHLCRLEGKTWKQETSIPSMTKDLTEGKKAFEEFGIRPTTIRIGEAYHSNELMHFLQELDLEADSTALPGRKRSDEEKVLSWELTPNRPYRPSRYDYRVPGTPELHLWEIPMNTVTTRVLYDKVPLLRYLNPAFHPYAYTELNSFLLEHDIIVSIMHPFEILSDFFCDNRMKTHPLLSFNPRALDENIINIKEAAHVLGKKIRFVTMNELLTSLPAHDNFTL